MTPENFVYWLKGYFELKQETNLLTPAQLEKIKEKLDMVFEPRIHIPLPENNPLSSRWNEKNYP